MSEGSCYRPFSFTITRKVGLYRSGDVMIVRCDVCGTLWLWYHVEYEGFTGSGRWFRGLIDEERAGAIQPEEAITYLCSLDWYLRGGSIYDGEISRDHGPVQAGLMNDCYES
jgi:hypothetical protein